MYLTKHKYTAIQLEFGIQQLSEIVRSDGDTLTFAFHIYPLMES